MKSLKQIPKTAQKLFKFVKSAMESKGHEELLATKIALRVLKDAYKPVTTGTKSLTIPSPVMQNGGTHLDVLLGYPGMDVQAMNGGILLGEKGWKTPPSGVLKGDMEHLYHNKALGLYTDDEWEGWVPYADRFWVDNNGLNARVHFPQNHPKNDEVLQAYNDGRLGLSIDYAVNEESISYKNCDGIIVPYAEEWVMTGFSFTPTPSYEKTKKNGNE